MDISQSYQYVSPLGPLNIVASDKGIVKISFAAKTYSKKNAAPKGVLRECVKQLDEYFSGNRKDFDIPLDLEEGTSFQQKVWQNLQKIKYGELKSYKDLAQMVRSPKAYRAVGGANNKNPIPIIIPCHRVVGSNGELVGYAGGLKIKKWLIHHEQQN